MRKCFIFAFAVLAVSASAKDIKVGEIVEIDDINYKIISVNPNEAEVTESPWAEGEIDILSEFTHYGQTVKVTKIGALAFYNGTYANTSITGTLTIPEGIREIEWQAFIACNRIDSISLPSTLEKVGQSVFYCYDDQPSTLHAVRCAAVMPPQCGEMVFGSRFNPQDGNSREAVLWVPVGTVLAYRAEKQWDFFNHIIDFECQESSTVTEEDGIEEVNSAVQTYKRIENGQLVIERNGVRYDATGANIK